MTGKKTYIHDPGFTPAEKNYTPAQVFGNASNYDVNESFEIAEDKKAVKIAEIKIDVYQINGNEDKKYAMTLNWKQDVWNNAVDIPIIFKKITNDIEHQKDFWSQGLGKDMKNSR